MQIYAKPCKNTRDDIHSSIFTFQGYTNIDNSTRIRGIVVYARENLNSRALERSTVYEEAIWLKMLCKHELLLGVFYRSPIRN